MIPGYIPEGIEKIVNDVFTEEFKKYIETKITFIKNISQEANSREVYRIGGIISNCRLPDGKQWIAFQLSDFTGTVFVYFCLISSENRILLKEQIEADPKKFYWLTGYFKDITDTHEKFFIAHEEYEVNQQFCESPIEEIFYTALFNGLATSGFSNFRILLQKEIKCLCKYRVDFAIWDTKTKRIILIIECDGYEYHNTREQFDIDRAKDVDLALKGYMVFRFSGRQIKNYCFQCVNSVLQYLRQYNERSNQPCHS